MQYTHFSLDRCNYISYHNAVVDYLINDAAEKKIVFLTSYYEKIGGAEYPYNIQNIINILKQKKPQWKIFLLFDSVYEADYRATCNLFNADDVLFLDYFLYGTIKNIVIDHVSPVAYKWNSQSSKFLCLTGGLHRINRFGLLYKLSQKNLLNHENCVWSLYEDREINLVKIISTFPELSKKQITEFVKNNISNPDNNKIIISADDRHHFYGNYKYNVNLYSQTKFSVVSESHFSNTSSPFITEKPWKAILNFHPFIIAGDTNTCSKLNKMSFVTYDQFLLYSDYDLVDDPLKRLDQVIDNIEFWHHHINDYEDEIKEITDYNHQMLINHYDRTVNLIENFLETNNLNIDVNEIVLADPGKHSRSKKYQQDNRFVSFYNAIKDPEWPECGSEEEFDLLPDYVKKECIEVFGYIPKNQ